MKTELKRLQDKKWFEDNREKARAYGRKWWSAHKDYYAARAAEWHKKHPEKVKFYALKKSSKERGMPFLITREEFSKWYLSREQKCEYCDLIDLSVGGVPSRGLAMIHFTIDRKNSDLPYEIGNMCLSCWNCNRLKSDLFTYEEWKEIAQKYIKPKWFKKLERVQS